MHCVRFEMRLNELLDERVSPETDRELIRHSENCLDCAELLAGHELLRSGREWFEPTIGPDFSVRVAAAFAHQDKRSWRGRWVGSLAAIAAGILIAVGILHFRNSMSGESDKAGRDSVTTDSQSTTPDYRGLLARTSEWSQRFGEQRSQWVDEMADGLKPVADSMSAALHALRRTLPRGEAPVRSSQFEPTSLKITRLA